jgi:NTE family protein
MFLFKDNKQTAETYYQEGKVLLDKQRWQEALRHFEKALDVNPQHTLSLQAKKTVLVSLAEQFAQERDWQVAEGYFNQAHQLAPNKMDIAKRLAFVRHQAYLTKRPACSVKQPSTSHITNLVFQGGGIKGLAYLGALEALFQRVDIQAIQRVGGTSAGAINALVLGLGYTLDELKQLLKDVQFPLFMDGEFREPLLKLGKDHERLQTLGEQAKHIKQQPYPSMLSKAPVSASKAASQPEVKMLSEGFKLLKQHDLGLFPGDFFREEWAEKLIQAKTGIAYATFAELQDLKAQLPELKDIYFVGANITTGQAEVFSHETTPDAIVSDALRISMSIPLVFKPHQLYRKIQGKRLADKKGHWYVDGGIVDNYALWLFDQAKYLPNNQADADTAVINPHTLGFRLVDNHRKAYYEQNTLPPTDNSTPDSLGGYTWQLLGLLSRKQESDHYLRQEKHRTIYIDYLGVQTTEFDLSDTRQEELIDSGRQAVNQYFAQQQQKLNAQLPLSDKLDAGWVYEAYERYPTKADELLRVQGVSLAQTDNAGNTALHLAVMIKDRETAVRLLQAGLPHTICNQQGNSALDEALAQQHKSMVLALVQYGAYACKQPEVVREMLQAALESGFVDEKAIKQQLSAFERYHYPVVTASNTQVNQEESIQQTPVFRY